MAMSCGCAIVGGMPLTTDWLKEHYKHTFEALMVWEIIIDPNAKRSNYDADGIGELRLKYMEALDKRFPAAAQAT